MKRLTEKEKETIVDLIKEGKSINEISRIMDKAKSTIYYHYKKNFGKKQKEVKFNFNDEELGEFLGIFAGDGCSINYPETYKYKITVSTGLYEKIYHEYLINFCTKIFDKKPQSFTAGGNVCILQYLSKPIYCLLRRFLFWENKKTYTIKLREEKAFSTMLLVGFIRGLFDTDGCFYKPKMRINLGTVSKELFLQMRSILEVLGYNPSHYVRKPTENEAKFYELALHGQESKKFIKMIKPRNKNKIAPVM